MLTRPPDLGDDALNAALVDGWDFDAVSVEYAPLGFGSHHWIATDASGDRRFITVDDQRVSDRDDLQRALKTAQVLRDAGLDFVVAPIGALHRVDDRFTMAVYPYLEGESHTWGEYTSDADRDAVHALLTDLHAATDLARPHAGTEDFAIDLRADLELALLDLDRPWPTGPYGEPARALLADHATTIAELLAEYDRRVGAVDRDGLVITHGEPHIANTMVVDGRWVLIDWDTALLGPPERDLWHLGRGDPSVIELYRLKWRLTEIAIYAATFRATHTVTADIVKSWEGLVRYVTGSS